MKREVIFLDQALRDLEIGRDFYNLQSSGLGDYFVDSLFADVASLKFFAGTHPKHFGLYKMNAKRFPFAFYYDFDSEHVRIAAILDMRQNPKSIRDDLRART